VLQYIAKRLLLMIPTLFGIMVVSFAVMQMAPGDPAAQRFGGVGQATGGLDAERGTEAAIKRFREKYHLDQPVHVQFGYFLQRFATGDLIYFQQERSIWPDLIRALGITVQIQLIVFVLIYLIAIPIGIYSAAAPATGMDRATTIGLFVLYSLPSFWVGSLLQLWLTDKSQRIWFPLMDLHTAGYRNLPPWEQFTDYLHHITLPVICLAYGALAYISRQMRAGLLEVVRQDYIRTARAKGCSKSRVILVHALRNGLFPIITLTASLLPMLIGGSVIVEIIFNIQGMGRFAFENMLRREYDAVMATLTLSAVMTLLGILVSDVLYVLVNPQVSFDERS
jgi:peptide/nickel transport system permease protein